MLLSETQRDALLILEQGIVVVSVVLVNTKEVQKMRYAKLQIVVQVIKKRRK